LDKNTIVELPPIKDLDEFNRTESGSVNTEEVPDVNKRYIMFIKKKKSLKLPLTYQEQKIINILA
jgi:hypothetical protein